MRLGPLGYESAMLTIPAMVYECRSDVIERTHP